MKIRALKAFTLRDSETGKLTSISHHGIAEFDDDLANALIADGLADEYTLITPTGTKGITANGAGIDVAKYASVDVNVPNPSTGTLTVTENGTYDVTEYASVVVNVPTTAEPETPAEE